MGAYQVTKLCLLSLPLIWSCCTSAESLGQVGAHAIFEAPNDGSMTLAVRQSPPPPPPPPAPRPPPPAPWRDPNLLYDTVVFQNAQMDPRGMEGSQRMQVTVERADRSVGPGSPNYQNYRTNAQSFVGRVMRAARGNMNSGGRSDYRAPVDPSWTIQPVLGFRMDLQLSDPSGVEGNFAFEYQDVLYSVWAWNVELMTNNNLETDGQVVIRWFLPQSNNMAPATDVDAGHITPQLASGNAIAVMRISRTVGLGALASNANPPAALLSIDRSQRSNTLTSRSQMGNFVFPGVGQTVNKWMRSFSEL